MSDEQDSGQDRTEEPTDKRRKDFREKGQVAQSRDLASVGVLAAVGLTVVAWWPSAVDAAGQMTVDLFAHGVGAPERLLAEPRALLLQGIWVMAVMCGPILLAGMVSGSLIAVAQVGISWSWKPLAPDLNRLNPIKGLQNKLFSAQAIAEWAKSMAKVILVGAVGYKVVMHSTIHLGELSLVGLVESTQRMGAAIGLLLGGLLLTMLVLSLGDLAFSKWQLMRKMRMTLQEMKQEHKESDGDPHMKAKRKQVMAKMSSNRLVAEVSEATVIVVNPTHYAVALKYELDGGGPPMVVARGVDEMARRIKDIARTNGIPRIENRPLARALYADSREGLPIPVELYEAVAEVLAFVYRLRESRRPGAPSPASAG